MAYKFQTGAAQMDGNLSQEGTLSGSGDLHLATAIDINGTEVLNSSGGGTGFTTANSLTSATGLVSVSALDAGSISANFGNIDNGTSNLTCGGIWKVDVDATGTGAGLAGAAGTLNLGTGNDLAIYHDSANSYVVHANTGDLIVETSNGGIILDAEDDTLEIKYSGAAGADFGLTGLNLVSGDYYQIAGTSVLNATTLGSAVVNSSLTSVGTLSSLGVGAVTSTGVVSSSNDGRFLALDLDDTANVLTKTTLGSTVLASSLTSVGTLTSLGVGAVTSTGIGSFAGLTSSAGIQADSTVQLDGVANATLSLAADSLYFLDADDGLMKRDAVSDIVTLVAGTAASSGLAASSGVLGFKPGQLNDATIASTDLIVFADANDSDNPKSEAVDDLFEIGPALVSAAVFAPGDDFVNFLDGGEDGNCQKDQWSDIATLVAGAGITATNGVFSVTADSSTPNAMSGGTSASPATMDEGLNYGSTDMLGPEQYWTVPASGLALGDVVRVKAPSGVTADNFIRITGAVAQNASFDGEKHIDLESPYAAVSLFVISADPLIFRII